MKFKKSALLLTGVLLIGTVYTGTVIAKGNGRKGMPDDASRIRVERVNLTEEQKAEMKEEFTQKLAALVEEGKLTQEEADERLSNFDFEKMPVGGVGRGFKGEKLEPTEEQKVEMKEKFAQKLAAMVETGKMTQEEADERLSNFDFEKMPFGGIGRGFKGEKPELTEEQKAEMKEKCAERLAKAIEAGKMTQEEADECLANFDSEGMKCGKKGRTPLERGQRPVLDSESSNQDA